MTLCDTAVAVPNAVLEPPPRRTTGGGGTTGKALRHHRLHRAGDGNLFVLPLDHSITLGPVAGAAELDMLVRHAGAAGVDAVVLHKGRVRRVDPGAFARMSLIVHLSADETSNYGLVAKVMAAINRAGVAKLSVLSVGE